MFFTKWMNELDQSTVSQPVFLNPNNSPEFQRLEQLCGLHKEPTHDLNFNTVPRTNGKREPSFKYLITRLSRSGWPQVLEHIIPDMPVADAAEIEFILRHGPTQEALVEW